MPLPTPLEEFQAIRNVLRVPFRQDLNDLRTPELPADRRWIGPCLGYEPADILLTATAPADKPKTEKNT